MTNLSYANVMAGRYGEAESNLSKLSLRPDVGNVQEWRYVLGVFAYLRNAQGRIGEAKQYLDRAFEGLDTTKTPEDFKRFHELASDVYARVGRNDLALRHHRAFKRLDDESRELMVNTNSALMAAEFDFATQDLKIARLEAEKLRKEAELATSRTRIILVLLGGSILLGGILAFSVLALRRSGQRLAAANTELNVANEALERALKAKSEFLASTSHEIRTPLNGILGVTQILLADPGISPEVRERVSLMHDAGESMRALVDDLLDAAKIESGALTIHKRETNLAGLLDDAVSLWTAKAQGKGLTLAIARQGAPERIVEDGSRLRQIIFNLLSNAIKFTEAGSVTLKAHTEPHEAGERLVIEVVDTGIGIPADRIDDVFESFHQVDSSVTRRFGGTGLGLSISRDLAEAMGGTLGVTSQLGRGSVFRLVLPLELPPAAEADAADAAPGIEPSFLIIESNPLTQSILKSLLTPLGLQVEVSGSLDAAAERLAAGGVARAIVDASLLGADDAQRLDAVKTLAAAGPCHLIVMWPSPDEALLDRLREAGADQVIAKPVSAADLSAALKDGRAAKA